METSWRAAIIRVLREAQAPMHYREISDQILANDYYRTDGATPASTVNAQIAASIKHERTNSPFIRVSRGTFALNQNQEEAPAPFPPLEELDEPINELSESIIHSFGMYWQRELVIWRNDPRLYGKQQALSKSVDFGKQKGIYILYDHHTVVYVGRSIDRPLGKRLYEHTVDRLGSRWNRFSWFGLLDVTQEGNLRETTLNTSLAALVATLEALLIEALEPPQNRKRGDDFSAIEYIQDIDSELKDRELKRTLREIEQRIRA